MGRDHVRRILAGATVAAALLAPTAAVAQTADPELSCVPDTVTAGATMTCTVAGVAASRAVDLELRVADAVVATADGVAATDGTATVVLTVPAATAGGDATVALVGTSVTLPVTVQPARPSTVSAGLGPSDGDVARTIPTAAAVTLGAALAVVAGSGRRRHGARDAA